MLSEIQEEASKKMDHAVDAVRREMAAIRTGRASVALLDGVVVSAYGSDMPLNQVATLASPEPSLLTVKPFDPGLIGAIERAIHASDLGLNPSNDGTLIRVPVPPLTEERRKLLSKKVHEAVEQGKQSVRNIRRDANDDIKKAEKGGDVGQDEAHAALEQVQKVTDTHVATLDQIAETKVQEIMTV